MVAAGKKNKKSKKSKKPVNPNARRIIARIPKFRSWLTYLNDKNERLFAPSDYYVTEYYFDQLANTDENEILLSRIKNGELGLELKSKNYVFLEGKMAHPVKKVVVLNVKKRLVRFYWHDEEPNVPLADQVPVQVVDENDEEVDNEDVNDDDSNHGDVEYMEIDDEEGVDDEEDVVRFYWHYKVANVPVAGPVPVQAVDENDSNLGDEEGMEIDDEEEVHEEKDVEEYPEDGEDGEEYEDEEENKAEGEEHEADFDPVFEVDGHMEHHEREPVRDSSSGKSVEELQQEEIQRLKTEIEAMKKADAKKRKEEERCLEIADELIVWQSNQIEAQGAELRAQVARIGKLEADLNHVVEKVAPIFRQNRHLKQELIASQGREVVSKKLLYNEEERHRNTRLDVADKNALLFNLKTNYDFLAGDFEELWTLYQSCRKDLIAATAKNRRAVVAPEQPLPEQPPQQPLPRQRNSSPRRSTRRN